MNVRMYGYVCHLSVKNPSNDSRSCVNCVVYIWVILCFFVSFCRAKNKSSPKCRFYGVFMLLQMQSVFDVFVSYGNSGCSLMANIIIFFNGHWKCASFCCRCNVMQAIDNDLYVYCVRSCKTIEVQQKQKLNLN